MNNLRRAVSRSFPHASIILALVFGNILFAQNAPEKAPGGEPGQNPETVYSGRGVTPPRLIYSPQPDYTDQARKAKLQGAVVLMVTVASSGEVADVRLVKGLGSGLDEKAIEAMQTWKFKPGLKDGTPVRTKVAVEVDFHLNR